MNGNNLEKIESIILDLLKEIGENSEREGLQKTPHRVAKSWTTFAKGYKQTPEEVVGDAVFNEQCDENHRS